jgi:hypothetical protein
MKPKLSPADPQFRQHVVRCFELLGILQGEEQGHRRLTDPVRSSARHAERLMFCRKVINCAWRK